MIRFGHLQWILVPACFLAIGLTFEGRSFAADPVRPDYDPVQVRLIELPGDVTGACFVLDRSGMPRFMACAGHKLMTWGGGQPVIQNSQTAAEIVDLVLALKQPIGRTSFVGYALTGKHLLFFDEQGALVAKSSLPEAGIDSLAIEGNTMLVDFGPGGGLRMYQLNAEGKEAELSEVWGDSEFGGWRVALADFGNGYVAAAAVMGGRIKFFSADGKRNTSRLLNYPMSVEPFPISRSDTVLVTIDEPVDEPEELLFLSPDRILFRQLIGRNDRDGNWRLRRLVSGRFIDDQTPTVAVLRGDGSVVIYDQAGKPQSMLPSVASRQAIELGPPHQGRDTLLCCEDQKLRQFAFPKSMPLDVAIARATIKNPNAELLKVTDRDTAQDLWARAIWLGFPFNRAASSEVASLYTAALSRSKEKAPIYVSLGDSASGPNVLREMLDKTLEDLNDKVVSDLAGAANQIAEKPELNPDESTKLLQQTIQNSYKAFATGDKSNELESIGKFLKEGSDASEMYYLAAVAEDPNYLPAWLRLATKSKGELRQRALIQLMRIDPDNALPDYLQATIDIESNDVPAAIKSISAGNRKRTFHIYETPRPSVFTLRYPDDEFTREIDVVGMLMPKTALDFWINSYEEAFAWNDFLPDAIRESRSKLLAEGILLRASGQFQSAIDVLSPVDEMCLQLIRGQPRGFGMIGLGLYRSNAFYGELQAAYEAMGDGARGQRLQDAEEIRLKLMAEMRSALSEPRITIAELKSIMQGKIDPVAVNRKRLDQALITSGIIQPLGKPQK